MRFSLTVLRRHHAINAVQIWAVFAFIALTVACGSPSPIEKVDDGFVSIEGTPNGNNPYMDIGCLTGAKMPTLIMHVGSNTTDIPAGAWNIQVGEWEATGSWERSAHYKKESSHVPNAQMGFDAFNQMINSGADSMTITMDREYTFPLSEEVRSTLRDEFPESCYIKPTVSVAPTSTPEPTPKPTPEPTPTPAPTSTPAWRDWKPPVRPTSTPISPPGTPLPPVDILSDCVGCPVIVPGEKIGTRSHQPVMTAYRNQPETKYHPDRVIVVGCYKGYYSDGLGYIMGARGSVRTDDFIAMAGLFHAKAEGQCYAVTAKYWGVESACVEYANNSCRVGIGRKVSILKFRNAGEYMKISGSQYGKLLQYARQNEYQPTMPTP